MATNLQFITNQTTTGQALLDLTNVFTDNYDVYFKTDAKKVKKKVKNVEGRMLLSVLMKNALKR